MATTNHAITNAQGHLETIVGAYKAAKWLFSNCRDGNDLNNDARQILREHRWNGRNDPDDVVEAIEDSMREEALSVEVRSNQWHGIGDTITPDEYRILLTYGGPALHIVGDLNCADWPINPRMQVQDWGIPWTDINTTSEEDEALKWFVGLFYFGA